MDRNETGGDRMSYAEEIIAVVKEAHENVVHASGEAKRVKENKYQRKIKGVTMDVYDVLMAFGVTNPAIQHAVKKLLMPGQRGYKDKSTDIAEAIMALQRAKELEREFE